MNTLAMPAEGPADYVSRRAGLAKYRVVGSRALVELLDHDLHQDWDHAILLPDQCLLNLRFSQSHAFASCPDFGNKIRNHKIGALSFIPPNTHIRFTCASRRVHTISCIFNIHDPQLCEDIAFPREWEAKQVAASFDIAERHSHKLMRQLAELLVHDGFGRRLETECYALLALSSTLATLSGRTSGAPKSGLAPWQIKAVEDRIMADDLPAPTLRELAQSCRISERHLTRCYRISRGHTLGEYMRSCHFARARDGLSRDMAIADIARTLGFASTSAFSTAFRRETGLSPSQYRREIS